MNVKDHKAERHLIAGASGTGKTTCLVRVIKGSKPQWLFVFDLEEELAGELGLVECTSFEEFTDSLVKQGAVCFNPAVNYAGDIPNVFQMFCEWVLFACDNLTGKKMFVCDEIQKVTDPLKPMEFCGVIMDASRRKQLDSAFGCQATNRIHNGIKGQMTHCYFYTNPVPNAQEFPTHLGVPESELRTLAEFEFIYAETRTGAWKKSKIIV